jgi:hypothetical protein
MNRGMNYGTYAESRRGINAVMTCRHTQRNISERLTDATSLHGAYCIWFFFHIKSTMEAYNDYC